MTPLPQKKAPRSLTVRGTAEPKEITFILFENSRRKNQNKIYFTLCSGQDLKTSDMRFAADRSLTAPRSKPNSVLRSCPEHNVKTKNFSKKTGKLLIFTPIVSGFPVFFKKRFFWGNKIPFPQRGRIK